MAALVTLASLALAAILFVGRASAWCWGDAFQCRDGQCIGLHLKCDGGINCTDGDDEGRHTCSAPNTTLAQGDTLTVRVQFDEREHHRVVFLLCDPYECSVLFVRPLNPSWGRMQSVAHYGCNTEGWWCRTGLTQVVAEGSAGVTNPLPPGELVFGVTHGPGELAVWLRGYPEYAGTVPAGRGKSVLRVKPLRWKREMPALFSAEYTSDVWPPQQPTVSMWQSVRDFGLNVKEALINTMYFVSILATDHTDKEQERNGYATGARSDYGRGGAR